MSCGSLRLDLGFFQLPRWGAALIVPVALVFHLGMPHVWPLLPVRPAVVDRIPAVVGMSVRVAVELDACLADPPPRGCRPYAARSWSWAMSEYKPADVGGGAGVRAVLGAVGGGPADEGGGARDVPGGHAAARAGGVPSVRDVLAKLVLRGAVPASWP